jgi:hypothetical protein
MDVVVRTVIYVSFCVLNFVLSGCRQNFAEFGHTTLKG